MVDLNRPSLDTPIELINFRVKPWITARLQTRIRNGLRRGGVMTLGDLVSYTEFDLELIDQSLGVVSRKAIKTTLKDMRLRLKDRRDL